MKRSLVRKKEALALLWQARRRDIEQIHEDLFLVPSKAHVCTDAEMYYTAFGLVKRLSSVYRDKRFMLIHNTGLHTLPWRKGVNNFMRVARVDMTAPETLTHGERLFMLRHNIAWEHYLVNYTNFTTLLESVEDVITDIDHIEFLYPLPARWPWIVQGNATQPHNATQPPHVEPRGDLEALAHVVERGVDLNIIWPGYRKPLLFDARKPDMVTAMIGYGVDVNSADDEGFSALQNALMVRGNSETVRTLIRLGADFSRVSNYGYTAINHAKTRIEVIGRSPYNPNATAFAESLQLNVDAYEEETWKIMLPQRQVAFAMGLHPRLGAESNVLCVDPDLLRMILTRI
ncbi:hypothetical protein T484DRAFT_1856264 [Baffinella frigidus]|nr:hypothetical protein T484DRAFT_1856264 [Cryptophyta sp. CCMP2293]